MSGYLNISMRYLLQAVNYTVFMALIWYFATAPSVQVLTKDQSVITIAFAHAGELKEPCRRLSQEELLKLPPNMRKIDDCPRERSHVIIEMSLDGKEIYNRSLAPPGLYGDGGVDVYYSAKIPAGEHRLEIKMDDSVRREGFNHTFSQDIKVAPAKILLVGFDIDEGFVLK